MGTANAVTGNGDNDVFKLFRGSKMYEFSNHLGNVLLTLTDKVLGTDQTGDGRAEFYQANVSTATDYYPFGSAMPGRSLNPGDYRFGFNGKENDATGEWGARLVQDYGFRLYNPGIGKFLSVDPLASGYPSWAPYTFAMNRVIDGIDLDGLEYVSAVNWALEKFVYTGVPFFDPDAVLGFNKYINPNWKSNPRVIGRKVSGGIACSESVCIAFCNGNPQVAQYLNRDEGMPCNRSVMLAFFQKGGEHHSFIPNKKQGQAGGSQSPSAGDLLFMLLKTGEGNGLGTGHVVILAGNITQLDKPLYGEYSTEDGQPATHSVLVLTTHTNTDFGIGILYLHFNSKNGSYEPTLEIPPLGGQYERQSYKIEGFGRVDEVGITGNTVENKLDREVKGLSGSTSYPYFTPTTTTLGKLTSLIIDTRSAIDIREFANKNLRR